VNKEEKTAYLAGLETAKALLVSVLMDFESREECAGVDTGAEQSALLVLDQKLIDAIHKARYGDGC